MAKSKRAVRTASTKSGKTSAAKRRSLAGRKGGLASGRARAAKKSAKPTA